MKIPEIITLSTSFNLLPIFHSCTCGKCDWCIESNKFFNDTPVYTVEITYSDKSIEKLCTNEKLYVKLTGRPDNFDKYRLVGDIWYLREDNKILITPDVGTFLIIFENLEAAT